MTTLRSGLSAPGSTEDPFSNGWPMALAAGYSNRTGIRVPHLVGVFSGGEWTPPDGVVDIINDITAILAKFSNGPTAPIKARCDLAPQVPDRIVDFPNDIQQVINAFQGQSYPFGFNGCP